MRRWHGAIIVRGRAVRSVRKRTHDRSGFTAIFFSGSRIYRMNRAKRSIAKILTLTVLEVLPCVVVSAEYHSRFDVARCSHVRQCSTAARTLETRVMPVTIQRVQKPSLEYPTTATRARLAVRRTARSPGFLLKVNKITMSQILASGAMRKSLF